MFRMLLLVVLTCLAWIAAASYCFVDQPWHWWAAAGFLAFACFLSIRLIVAAARGLSRVGL